MLWLLLLLPFIFGACLLAYCLCAIAKQADEDIERMFVDRKERKCGT